MKKKYLKLKELKIIIYLKNKLGKILMKKYKN